MSISEERKISVMITSLIYILAAHSAHIGTYLLEKKDHFIINHRDFSALYYLEHLFFSIQVIYWVCNYEFTIH